VKDTLEKLRLILHTSHRNMGERWPLAVAER
jgi:hypothetical protein